MQTDKTIQQEIRIKWGKKRKGSRKRKGNYKMGTKREKSQIRRTGWGVMGQKKRRGRSRQWKTYKMGVGMDNGNEGTNLA